MAAQPGALPPTEERVSTGSPELDTILHGGLVPHRPYLIVGPAGTGKTTLALQFLCEGVRRGERCLLITLEEPPNEMRINHRGLGPELEQVYVFDAIPDVMRYERTPFKDIAAVRESVTFSKVPYQIRKTPELSSVEVTFTALEQTVKMEVARRAYSRIVIDSLTALQYFCMKGVDEIVGAQTFLRFLSDLRVTTLLTVESPLEDVETPERLLARGEIRLFRWELDGRTVRAIGVEKLRGSSHDVRLHPYRISAQGIRINLGVTISRDTRRVIEEEALREMPAPELVAPVVGHDPIAELEAEIPDLQELGVPLADVRSALAETVAALEHERIDEALRCFRRARQTLGDAIERLEQGPPPPTIVGPGAEARARLLARAVEARGGSVPVAAHELPPAAIRLKALVDRMSVDRESSPVPPSPIPSAAAPVTTATTPPSPAPLAPPAMTPPPVPAAPSVPTPVPSSAPVPPPPAVPPAAVAPTPVSAPPPSVAPAAHSEGTPPSPVTTPRAPAARAAPTIRAAPPKPAASLTPPGKAATPPVTASKSVASRPPAREPPPLPTPRPAPVRTSDPAPPPAPPNQRPVSIPPIAPPAPSEGALPSDRPALPSLGPDASAAAPIRRVVAEGVTTEPAEAKEPGAKRRKRATSAPRRKSSVPSDSTPAEAGAPEEVASAKPKRRAPRKRKGASEAADVTASMVAPPPLPPTTGAGSEGAGGTAT